MKVHGTLTTQSAPLNALYLLACVWPAQRPMLYTSNIAPSSRSDSPGRTGSCFLLNTTTPKASCSATSTSWSGCRGIVLHSSSKCDGPMSISPAMRIGYIQMYLESCGATSQRAIVMHGRGKHEDGAHAYSLSSLVSMHRKRE